MKKKNIILVGLKHSGKTSVGKILSAKTSFDFLDTDQIIKEITNLSAREIYKKGGKDLFIKKELKAINHLVDVFFSKNQNFVIATGGGISDNIKAFNLLKKNGLIVFIDTNEALLFDRILNSAKKDDELPPFLDNKNPKKEFSIIYKKRKKVYFSFADIHLIANEKTAEEISNDILQLLCKNFAQ